MGDVERILEITLQEIEDPECWCKRASHRVSGDQWELGERWVQDQHCLSGAMEIGVAVVYRRNIWNGEGANLGTEGNKAFQDAINILNSHVPSRGEGMDVSFVTYNDASSTTHEDVVLLLKKAINEAAEKGI